MKTHTQSLHRELAAARQRLTHVLRAMGAGLWEWDLSNDSTRLDERWAQILGYQLEELGPITSQTAARLTHADDHAECVRRAQACLDGRSDQFVCESRARHKDGHWVWVLDSGSVMERDDQGRPLRMLGTRQDISDRKLASEALRKESERFIALARVSNTGVWEWDQARQYLWCSPEYFSMLGLNPGDFSCDGHPNLDNTWLQFLHPDDRQPAADKFGAYLAAGAIGMYENEFRMRHADGHWIWIWSRGSALRDADGRLTDKVMGTHINISSLKEAQARLRESQQQLLHISNNLPDTMIYQLDCGSHGEQRQLSYVSAGVRALHGLSAAQVMADALRLYAQVLPQDRPRLDALERRCIERLEGFRCEFRLRLPDGQIRWRLMASSPRRLDNGHVLFDGIEMDITARKQQEEQIQHLNAHLEQSVEARTRELRQALQELRRTQEGLLQSEKLASLGALVAGVAHELNTPIGNAVTVASTLTQAQQRIATQIQSGLTRNALNDYLQEMAEGSQIIERNLARAADLISSFKQLAVDQTSAQRRRFAINELLQEISLAMRPSLRKTPYRVVIDAGGHLQLDSYPGPLGQVLMNLINNALLHAFAGLDQGCITLRVRQTQAGWLCLTVSDNGCGISAENQKKIFDPFFTTRLGQGGSGLGLHICHTLVSGLLGGHIELHSSPGQGSHFNLHLPLCAPQPKSPPASPSGY